MCSDNCSLMRCEDVRISSPDGRFDLAFPGKRLYLRAANCDEAEDWVDRIVEAVNKCRPASHSDEQWEVLQPVSENGVDVSSPSSAPSSPERSSSSDSGTYGGQEAPPPPPPAPPLEFDWTWTADLETDSIKESVLYFSTDSEARSWVPLVFSLSLEALKGFRLQEGRKLLRQTHPIEEIRDVVPDVSLGGPAFFKLLTVKETLRLRAESAEEARSWRVLIRETLDSYLESGEDGSSAEPAGLRRGVGGNLHRLVQHRLKEDGALLVHLCTVPSESGLDAQSFKCAGKPVYMMTLLQNQILDSASLTSSDSAENLLGAAWAHRRSHRCLADGYQCCHAEPSCHAWHFTGSVQPSCSGPRTAGRLCTPLSTLCIMSVVFPRVILSSVYRVAHRVSSEDRPFPGQSQAMSFLWPVLL